MPDVEFKWDDNVIDQIKKNAGEACRAAADLMLEQALIFCPYDTGELYRSGSVVSDNLGETHVVTFRAPYAYYVEYGYKGSNGWVPGQYYLTKAVQVVTEAFPEIVSQSFSHGSHSSAPNTWQHGVIVGI